MLVSTFTNPLRPVKKKSCCKKCSHSRRACSPAPPYRSLGAIRSRSHLRGYVVKQRVRLGDGDLSNNGVLPPDLLAQEQKKQAKIVAQIIQSAPVNQPFPVYQANYLPPPPGTSLNAQGYAVTPLQSITGWLTGQSIPGVPNIALAGGAGLVGIALLSKRRR